MNGKNKFRVDLFEILRLRMPPPQGTPLARVTVAPRRPAVSRQRQISTPPLGALSPDAIGMSHSLFSQAADVEQAGQKFPCSLSPRD
jgi:hypothetical protein